MIRSCDNTSQNSNGKTDSCQISNLFFFFTQIEVQTYVLCTVVLVFYENFLSVTA